jgi:guanylate kinase/adenylate cyclase class IV
MTAHRNIEFKARNPFGGDLGLLSRTLAAGLVSEHAQEDVYLMTEHGRLKIRTTDDRSELIFYERLNSASARESTYFRAPLAGECAAVEPLLKAAVGSPATVRKQRSVLRRGDAIINADVVSELGNYIEVEVPIECAGSLDRATEIAHELRRQLGITYADLIPFSYADLLLMTSAATRQRQVLGTVAKPGHLYLLDGVSASGKTSLLNAIVGDASVGVQCVPRHTTRAPRAGASESEYIFISPREFHRMVSTGAFIEFRDFAFGMSYGLSWEAAMAPVSSGADGVALINLGIVRHVADLWPEAVRILIDAPLETLERRLRARGHNTEEQIQERLGNAALVADYRPYYHHVINNDDGMFEQSLATLAKIISSGRQ